MATDTESMQDNMTRLRMRMMQQKLANERERLQRPESADSEPVNGYDSQLKLQQAMYKRQELLDRIKAEQFHEGDRRPRTYTPRRRYTPSPLPPPSRRSLPDISNTKHYHFGYAGGSHPDMTQVRHVIEHQFKNVSGPQQSYALPPIQTQGVPQMTGVQPMTPYQPSYQPYPMEQKRDTMFNKADFMDMMMLQNAQMHHMVMQQMMLHQLPGGSRPHTHPYAEPAPYAMVRPIPSVYHHHVNSQPYQMPPMDYRGGGFRDVPARSGARRGGRTRLPVKGVNRAPVEGRAPADDRGPPAQAPTALKVVRTDNVKKPSKLYPFPGPMGLRRLRHIAYASWFIASLKTMLKKKKDRVRPSSVFLFGIILKEMVAALHRIYLNPNGNIYPVMMDVIGPNAQDLSQLLYRPGPPAEAVRGGRGGPGRAPGARDENAELFQILQYVIENLVYHMTEIMPKTGVLGTHKKAAAFELIKSNKRFPDGYFWQIELDHLEFDGSGRTKNVGNLEAFILLVGVFLSRSMITTLLMRPVDYGLSNEALSEIADRNLKVLATALLFIVRRVSVKRESPMLPMPGEVARYVFADEEMRPLHIRLRKTYEYCENLLREWGAEYIKRLRQAANTATTTNAAPKN